MNDDKPLELPYPLRGLDRGQEFGVQPNLTTAQGRNVRACEPEEERVRGGSRHGLSKYVDEQLPLSPFVGGSRLIQHLALIVDPTTDATLDTQNILFNPGQPNEGDGTHDPSTNNRSTRNPGGGRYVRDGGNGWDLFRRDVPGTVIFQGLLADAHPGDGDTIGDLLLDSGDLLFFDIPFNVMSPEAINALIGQRVTATPTGVPNEYILAAA